MKKGMQNRPNDYRHTRNRPLLPRCKLPWQRTRSGWEILQMRSLEAIVEFLLSWVAVIVFHVIHVA